MCEMYDEEEEEVRRKVAVLEEMKMVVKRLQCGDGGGAHEVRRLCKDDHGGVRMNFGLLGVIPPLVAMVDDGGGEEKIVALYALLNLGIGHDE